MTVSGPTAAAVGAQYSTTHAISPVTWSISSGTISSDGKVLEIGCGNYTVTATDFCGRTASIAATLSSTFTISGTETPVVGSGYSASGAVGAVSWSMSPGTINSETGVITVLGCGTGTITAIDSCGRSASMEVRFPNGYWQQQSYEYFSGGSWAGATLISGGTKYVEQFTGKTNPIYTDCWVWNDLQGKCIFIENWCHYDGGFLASWERPKTISDIVYSETPSSDPCNSYVHRTYYVVCTRYTYRWVCP